MQASCFFDVGRLVKGNLDGELVFFAHAANVFMLNLSTG